MLRLATGVKKAMAYMKANPSTKKTLTPILQKVMKRAQELKAEIAAAKATPPSSPTAGDDGTLSPSPRPSCLDWPTDLSRCRTTFRRSLSSVLLCSRPLTVFAPPDANPVAFRVRP